MEARQKLARNSVHVRPIQFSFEPGLGLDWRTTVYIQF